MYQHIVSSIGNINKKGNAGGVKTTKVSQEKRKTQEGIRTHFAGRRRRGTREAQRRYPER